MGTRAKIHYVGIDTAVVTDANGNRVCFESPAPDFIEFDTEVGGEYTVTDLPNRRKINNVFDLKVDRETLKITWKADGEKLFNVYRAENSDPEYTQIASCIEGNSFTDSGFDFSKCETATYKVTATDGRYESFGEFKTINHATRLELDRYKNIIMSKDDKIKL